MLKYRRLVVALAAAFVFFGILQLRNVPVDVLPEFSPPTVQIQTEALGLSAIEVEQLITVPMEQNLLNGVAFLDVIRSESVPGLSSIELIFEPGTDIWRARQLVQERLTQAHDLPQVSKAPQMLQPLSSTSRLMMIGLSSNELSLIETSVLARWVIRPRLMGVPGVANVATWGHRERQLQVQVDPSLLRDKGVSLNQVISTSGNALWVSPLTFLEASTPGTGGFIDTPNQRLTIQHLLPIRTAEELAQVSLEGAEDRGLRLGDVAHVVEDHQPLIGDAVFSDRPGLLLVVEKLPGSDTVEVTREVEEALEELRPGLGDIQFDSTVFRPATYIENGIGHLTTALLIGGLLIILVLAAFLFEWRTVLIAAVAIPLSLVAAGVVIYLRGTTVNAMSLAGLMVGLVAVIDDAVIDAENIGRRLRQRRESASATAWWFSSTGRGTTSPTSGPAG